MFASTTLIAVFTLVFAVTGVYSLARLSQLLAGPDEAGDRLAELFHLAMSLAMIGMAVAWTGGPETVSGRVQIVVFGAFTLWFAYRTATRADGHGHAMGGHLVAMGAAMTWMVATMTVLMGHTGAGGSGGGGHHGAPSDAASSGPEVSVTPAPGWVVAVTIAFAVLFVVTGCWWAVRAVRINGLCHALRSLDTAGMLVAMI